MKTCNGCGQSKVETEFDRVPRMADGLRGKCKGCCKEMRRARREADPEKARDTSLRHNLGISLAQYKGLARKQASKCAICLEIHPVLCVDHCHTRNIVRGLLCRKCNAAIGQLKDAPDLIIRALVYLMFRRTNIRVKARAAA